MISLLVNSKLIDFPDQQTYSSLAPTSAIFSPMEQHNVENVIATMRELLRWRHFKIHLQIIILQNQKLYAALAQF